MVDEEEGDEREAEHVLREGAGSVWAGGGVPARAARKWHSTIALARSGERREARRPATASAAARPSPRLRAAPARGLPPVQHAP